ncbi:unnamed protein product, partial [Staurois parvus]
SGIHPTAGFTGPLLSLALASLVWAPGCDSLRLHSQVPTAHAQEVLRFVNGPVVFGDLSRVPEDYGEGGGGDNFHFRSPRKIGTFGERVPEFDRHQFP